MSWLKKKTGPVAQEADTVEALKTIVDKDDVVVVGFFKVRGARRAPD